MNHKNQFRSISIDHKQTQMTIQMVFYTCLLSIAVFIHHGNRLNFTENFFSASDTILLAKIQQNRLEIVALALKSESPTLPLSLVNKPLHDEDPKFSEVSLSHAVLRQTKSQFEKLSELYCLALNVYFEARGESELGQRAVGHVVLNRVASRKFPKSICEVVRQGGEQKRYRCQFSWWCDGHSDNPRNKLSWYSAIRISKEIIEGASVDPTNGALWYHAHYVSPYWRTAFLQGPTIGQHIFYLNQTRKS